MIKIDLERRKQITIKELFIYDFVFSKSISVVVFLYILETVYKSSMYLFTDDFQK